ncbi:MAG: hypothetical protein L0G27_07375 [Paracoccus sp. (in: a-proteobacteria)]|nr:hypothetical protein [Paracoccus sp. (in: a-proteobacteria)]
MLNEDVQTAQSNQRCLRQRVAAHDQAAVSYGCAFVLARENFEREDALQLVGLLDANRHRASARPQASSAPSDAAAEGAVLQIATGPRQP